MWRKEWLQIYTSSVSCLRFYLKNHKMLEPGGTCDPPPHSSNLLFYRWENRHRERERQHSESQSGPELLFPLSSWGKRGGGAVCSLQLGGIQMTNSSPDVIANFLKTNSLLRSLCSLILLLKLMALKNYLYFFLSFFIIDTYFVYMLLKREGYS